jgi:uncharacterized protein (DUF1501 family)
MQRRDFLKLLSTIPLFSATKVFSLEHSPKRKYWILIELKGGNDGLNTVIPYNDNLYYENRPTLQIPLNQVLKINYELGLNPALTHLQKLYKENDLSIIQNVGYANPNKSHFTSLDIWETASENKGANGWLYELFKRNQSDHLIDAMVFSGSTGLFEGSNPNFLKVKNIRQFVKHSRKLKIPDYLSSDPAQAHLLNSINKIHKVASRLEDEVDLDEMQNIKKGKISLSDQLMQASFLMQHNVDIPIFKVAIKGFDTHSNQENEHKDKLTELNDALAKFTQELKSNNLWDDTLIMTYSEFGRRIKENGSKGTDHGEASCMFCMGGKVKGGIYGDTPDLKNHHDDNLVSMIDFREVYSELEKKWLKSDNKVVQEKPLNFLRS